MADDDNNNQVTPEENQASTEAPEATEGTTGDEKDLNLPEHQAGEASTSEGDMNPPELSDEEREKGLKVLYEVPVQVSAILGKTTMQVNQLLKLGRGAVVELDRRVGDAIDIYVNDRLVARGEVIVVDEHLGVTLTEIIKADQAA